MSTADHEERFVDIEIKLAHQEDLVESLNALVYEQQKRMDKLEALCAALVQRVREGAADGGGPGAGHEKPPHY
jgi:SlyX protein